MYEFKASMGSDDPMDGRSQSDREGLRDHSYSRANALCIDRMHMNVYVPQLQRVGGVVWYLRGHPRSALCLDGDGGAGGLRGKQNRSENCHRLA
ncbi:hypothetical protein [Cupriavidus sp. D39]|uniref:hypothetical protein n=1 Tax=Cupriavidus sp. D39 TaxID=2997877 RepID=UPI00226F5EEB|nr:hypothetical protein [Cupriavidus sp. D39]MCY0853323.1 hypothetical protein [Cupriavidus sp. D39]